MKKARSQLLEVADELEHRSTGRAKNLLLELRPSPPERSHCIYVIELDDAVRQESRFRNENEDQLRTGLPALYVGMTNRTPEERYAQHKSGVKSARFVRDFGLRLRPEFYLAVNPMTRARAAEFERELASRLKTAGYPTWQR